MLTDPEVNANALTWAENNEFDWVAAALPEDPRVELVPAGLAKGMEFDHVGLVEPAAIAGEPVLAATGERVVPVGLRQLYVALIRAVSRLTVVHSRDLPAPAGAGERHRLEPGTPNV